MKSKTNVEILNFVLERWDGNTTVSYKYLYLFCFSKLGSLSFHDCIHITWFPSQKSLWLIVSKFE